MSFITYCIGTMSMNNPDKSHELSYVHYTMSTSEEPFLTIQYLNKRNKYFISIQDNNSTKCLLYPSSSPMNNLIAYIEFVIQGITMKQMSIHPDSSIKICTNIGFLDTYYPLNKIDAIIDTSRIILSVLEHIELLNPALHSLL